MSDLNHNTGEAGNATPQAEGKTFTQDDVNRIVQDRLAKERTKLETDLASREQELAKRELLLTAKEKLTERGLPLELLDALNVSTPEALEASLSIVQNAINKADPKPPPLIVGAKPAESPRTPLGSGSPDIRQAMGLN